MIIAIIPSHNQSHHIEKIIKGYENQTKKIDLVLFVFDRCIDESLNIIKNIQTNIDVKWIIKEEGNNFSAGMTRDFGVDYVLSNYNFESIVFTDGDCVPSYTLVEEHYTNLNRSKKAIVSCGKRLCEKENGEWEDDERNIGEWVNGFGFDNNGKVVLSRFLTIENILTYSCNLAFNKKAIMLCREINLKLSNEERVFNPEFDGSWGGEDNFISHCLYLTNNYIVLTSNNCWVNHYYHKEEKKELDKKNDILRQLSLKLTNLVLNKEIEGEITNIETNYPSNLYNFNDIVLFCVEYKEFLDFEKELATIAFLSFSRIIKFIFINKSSIKIQEVSKLKEKVNYMKFYLNNDIVTFKNDLGKFKYKLNVYSHMYGAK